jgi:CDP-4-dehydro-6-deoxyglucose reductase
MPVTWYERPITRIETLAPNVRRFWLAAPDDAAFSFKAGQFITMDLPIGDKRLQRWRSYSIANAPDGSGQLEFCIVRSSEGAGTRYLFEETTQGTTVRFKGPEGGFVLPEVISNDLVFICTGTGVAPFRSMLLDLKASGKPHRNIHLIFGCRTEVDILYRDEFEELARTMPGFRYDIALSRQPDWPGTRGHVHQIYLEHYAQKRPDVTFYLCGWTNMIDDAVANLIVKLGYDRGQVVYELYG